MCSPSRVKAEVEVSASFNPLAENRLWSSHLSYPRAPAGAITSPHRDFQPSVLLFSSFSGPSFPAPSGFLGSTWALTGKHPRSQPPPSGYSGSSLDPGTPVYRSVIARSLFPALTFPSKSICFLDVSTWISRRVFKFNSPKQHRFPSLTYSCCLAHVNKQCHIY